MKMVKEILSLAAGFLEKHQVSSPRLSAETLLAHFLDLKRIELYMHFDRPVQELELELFRSALKKAVRGDPLSYILGEVEFYGARIKVTPAVLIPRQETEILLDMVSKQIDSSQKRVIDLCSGSGCLAIGLKKAHPNLEVVGVDLSLDALEIARENSAKNNVEIKWFHGDLIEPVKDQKFDLVLCNPPYVTEADYETLDPGVRNFEPKMALVSGVSGYEVFERLQQELPEILNPGAKVFCEIGTGQGAGVLERFSSGDWKDPSVKPDWAGHDRFFSTSI